MKRIMDPYFIFLYDVNILESRLSSIRALLQS